MDMQFVVLLLIRVYKRSISPFLPSSCRFYPTCSDYMAQAVRYYGVRKGIWMGLRRIGRCHPLHPGGYDPVPEPEQLSPNKKN